ncbi:MAG: T9SS type A sorting domain-containing protein [Ignavibacteriales bacterium]|nr:T9SS type A sorting domain-containing protein [Ignavibacteriales bacterium]
MKTKEVKVELLIIILFLFGFNNYIQAQELDPYQFFPANVGDRWEYTYAGPDLFYSIARDSIDTKDSSRIIFYDTWTTYNPIKSRYPLYRIDKNYNVFNDPLRDNRHLYKLDAKVDEWWIVMAAERTVAKVLDISQTYIFGKLTTVKTIGFYRLAPGDTVINENSILDYWEKLAYGFGKISRENGATQPLLLRGCRINGVTYGTVDVKEEPRSIPSEFILYQNYPNPFNPTTVIGYQLSVTGHVTLRVYDLLGREIATLVNKEEQVGKYEVKFDGGGLTSGVYFYQLITNQTMKTIKMILQK